MTADLSSRIKNCDADLPSGNCLAGWHWGEEREDLFNQICLSSSHFSLISDIFGKLWIYLTRLLFMFPLVFPQ